MDAQAHRFRWHNNYPTSTFWPHQRSDRNSQNAKYGSGANPSGGKEHRAEPPTTPEKNTIARIHNSRLSDETHRLENIQDEEIEGFPETSGDITRLNAAGVNALLRQLGLAVNGGLEDKKQRLRRHIGLMVL
ncbi:hypothetical protein L211DRAFT_845221 [Terfezia boudieri ATCC MYA-4762]|uniref:SAP domain-containing protein n=1 Tax=Terfezia boudieri ATCC MYA-4762 TaxID=1051890 RepID=A0A3N4M671_9PEZI|nr:hypothetical protein L211DRAFT_845221 [Terfezia boudieri ATCC MYA-4762]